MDEEQKRVNWYIDNTKFSCSEILVRVGMQNLEVNSKEAKKISSVFGGGIASQGEICGAVTGAIFALGLKYGREDESISTDEVRAKTRDLCQAFQQEYGYLRCSDLTFRLDPEDKKKKCHGIIRYTSNLLLERL